MLLVAVTYELQACRKRLALSDGRDPIAIHRSPDIAIQPAGHLGPSAADCATAVVKIAQQLKSIARICAFQFEPEIADAA